MEKGEILFENKQKQKRGNTILNDLNIPNRPETRKNLQKLDILVNESNRTLLKVKTVFPFNFFPDEIIIDEIKVSIIHNLFFFSNQIRSVAHEDILNVVIEHHIFFATLEIMNRFFVEQPITVRYLRKDDALLARSIIQGIIIAKKEGVDFNMVTVKDLLQKAKKIGEV